MDTQEENVSAGRAVTDKDFGIEPQRTWGLLTTLKKVDTCQAYYEAIKKYHGRFPSLPGNHLEYYKDVVAAIRGEKELVVNPSESRDGIRIIELARESHKKGVTVKWS